MMNVMNVEVIDFTIPICNRKNLFITNIQQVEEEEVYDILHTSFSRFGLLHEVQIFNTTGKHGSGQKGNNSGRFYAFVKFYSYRAAANARQVLGDKLTIGDHKCKIAYAKRRRGDNQVATLPVNKCYELAHHYLGFNGWSTKLLKMAEDPQNGEKSDDVGRVKFFCKLSLELTNQNLACDGVGVWEETYAKKDLAARGSAMAKVRKFCYSRAMQDAFSKLLILSLSNGKVWVEVNTTLVDTVLQEDELNTDQVLKITELEQEPAKEEDKMSGDLDDVNLQILQELEDS